VWSTSCDAGAYGDPGISGQSIILWHNSEMSTVISPVGGWQMEDSRIRVRVPAGLRIIHRIVHLAVINWDGRHFPAFSSTGSLVRNTIMNA
jgi:hypothetical protein